MIETPARDARRPAQRRGRAGVVRRAPVLFPALLALLVLAVLLNVGIGAVRISPLQVIAILLHHAGISVDVAYTAQQDAVLWAIRLPRVVLAGLAGGGLGVSGAALQGVFRNPLADPSLIGVSSGAALGAVAAIIVGVAPIGAASLPVAAFTGGLLAAMVVYAFARFDGRTEVVTLILTGIAINAIAGAGIGMLTFVASDQQLRSIVFWTLGSVGGATWSSVLAVAPFILAGLILMPRWARALNLLVLGEREAHHLGVATERVRLIVITLAALVTGASVAMAGIIGFVGLIVPHIIRLIAGPDHRVVLPASALAGASLLLFADLAARTVAIPREVPLGVVTSLAGGPFFLWLVQRTRRLHGGWG